MSELAIRLINEAYEKKSEFLDLGNCGLREIPKEIVKLKDTLQHLNLGSYYKVNDQFYKSRNNFDSNHLADNEQSLFLLSELHYLKSLFLYGNAIGQTGAIYISTLTSLTSLDLFENIIGDRGAEYISRLSSLTSLDLSYNKIGDHGAEYISRLSSLQSLELINNKIGEKGTEYISRLITLKSLNLHNNKIGDHGAEYISWLSSLTSLNLASNEIGDKGAEYLSRLSSLMSLNLASNEICEKGAEYISRLSSLTSLNLASNEIGEKGAEYISRLTTLKSLNLHNNKIGEKKAEFISALSSLTYLNLSVNNMGDQDAEYISRLSSLTSLHLYNNNIGEKGAKYLSRLSSLTLLDLDNNNIGDKGAEYISRLSTLKSLNLHNNEIGDTGAEYISRLSLLTSLDLNKNEIREKGAEYLSRLPYLTDLNLAHNKIATFNGVASTTFHTLNLQGNLLETISLELIKHVPIEIDITKGGTYRNGRLFLYGNPIKNVPPEVLIKGRNAIIEYLEGKLRPLNECKLIFVGDGSVGKTSLMKRLVYDKFSECEITTHGINKIAWRDIVNEQGEPVKVNCWDFGGQHIQHSLHQFFFTKRVVYVLVLNPRNDEKANYWLDQIDKLGCNSQIIIVYNWKDKEDIQADYLRNFRELRKTYKFLPEPITLSCETGLGMRDFISAVKNAVLANEGLKIEYPETWFNIKEKLETRIPIEKHYIKYTQYETWCEEEKYNDSDQRRNLLRILDSVGSIIFFDKPVLNELQVLNPEWITTGAYAILTAEITKQKKGHLTWKDLVTIFSTEKEIFSDKNIRIKYEESQFKFILQLMLDYRLCQNNPLVEHEYLIPGAFGEKPNKDYDVAGGRHYRLKFQSPFEILVIHRFIAKNILNIVSNDYWNSGIYFKHASSETYALVDTNQYSQVIDCWIKGENIRGMWEVIRNDFREIVKMYHNILVEEQVEYMAGERTVFFIYEEMLAALKNGVHVIPYDTKTGLKDIDVNQVLELFETPFRTQVNIEMEKIKVEVNPQITVSPQFNNNPVINNSQVVTEPEKSQPPAKIYDLPAENKKVKKWKNKAIVAFVLSLMVTVVLVVIWVNKWILSVNAWSKLEHYEVVKWVGLGMTLIWNVFIARSLYDRLWDPTKEKAYRERMRK